MKIRKLIKLITQKLWRKTCNLLINQDANKVLNVLPSNKGPRVHLGSGPINIQGWINIDARQYPHTHIQTSRLTLDEFNENSISEIYLCHVLEHFSFIEVTELLNSFYKKLKPGACLRLSVPDFDKLIDIYIEESRNLNLVKYALYGGQDYSFNFHKSCFNCQSLSELLKTSNFHSIEEWTTLDDFGLSLGDWSDQFFNTKNGPKKISLNLKCMK